MAIGKMLTALAFLAVTCPGYSRHLSGWGQRDGFDNDVSSFATNDVDNNKDLHEIKSVDINNIKLDDSETAQLDDSDDTDNSDNIDDLHDVKPIDSNDINLEDSDDTHPDDLDNTQLDDLDNNQLNEVHDIKSGDSNNIDHSDDVPDLYSIKAIDSNDINLDDDTHLDYLNNIQLNDLHALKPDDSDDIDNSDNADDLDDDKLDHLDDTQLNKLHDVKLDDGDEIDDSDDANDSNGDQLDHLDNTQLNKLHDIKLDDGDDIEDADGIFDLYDIKSVDSNYIDLDDSDKDELDTDVTQPDDLHGIKLVDFEDSELNSLENPQLPKNTKYGDSDIIPPDDFQDKKLDDSHDVEITDKVYTPLENAYSLNLFESNESPFDDSNNMHLEDSYEIEVIDSGKVPLNDYYYYNTSDDNTIVTQLDDSHKTRLNYLDDSRLDNSHNAKSDDWLNIPLENVYNGNLQKSERLKFDDSNDIPVDDSNNIQDDSTENSVNDSNDIPINVSNDIQLDDSVHLDDSVNAKFGEPFETPLKDLHYTKSHKPDTLQLDEGDHTQLDNRNDINFHYSSNNDVNVKIYEICNNEDCRFVAKTFAEGMNKSVNPCDDFYEFACGAWAKKKVVPQGRVSWDQFKDMRNAVETVVGINLLAKPHSDDIIPVKQAKRWFAACMNADNRDKRGIKPIATILMETGNWPIIMEDGEWDADVYPWQKVERFYTRLTGTPTLYNLKSTSAFGGPNFVSPDVPIDYFKLKIWSYNGKNYEEYIRAIENTVTLFLKNQRVKKEKIRREVKEIVDFEKAIYKLKQKRPVYRKRTFDKFVKFYDTNVTAGSTIRQAKIEWKSMINELSDMLNIKINTSTAVFGYDYVYIKGLNELLKRTPARTIVNYIHWNFVAKTIQYTDRFSTRALFKLHQLVYGPIDIPPRWTQCIDELPLPHAAFLFINKNFANSSEPLMREMMNNMQIGLKNEIDNSNWLNGKFRKWAKDKVQQMKFIVGIPDWYTNETAITKKYKGLIVGNDHFDNSLNSMRFLALEKIKILAHPGKQSLDPWSAIDPFDIKAHYFPEYNKLFAPTVILPTGFLRQKYPSNVKYGIFTHVLGQQMAHAFDTKGIKYGGYKKSPRLPNTVLRRYKRRAQCFVNQYAEYFNGYFKQNKSASDDFSISLSPMEISVQMKDENIADSIGLQASFKGYKELSKKFSNGDTKLPDLEEFTDDQLFFISYAAMACEAYSPQSQRKKIEATSTHSPGRFKVIGSVSNTKEFANAFNCPIGSPMNPRKKCNIWKKKETTTEQNYRRWLAQLMR